MYKQLTEKQRAAKLNRQLAFWAANEGKNNMEKAEFTRLRALGKLPSVVDRFNVQKYQKSVIAFNASLA